MSLDRQAKLEHVFVWKLTVFTNRRSVLLSTNLITDASTRDTRWEPLTSSASKLGTERDSSSGCHAIGVHSPHTPTSPWKDNRSSPDEGGGPSLSRRFLTP